MDDEAACRALSYLFNFSYSSFSISFRNVFHQRIFSCERWKRQKSRVCCVFRPVAPVAPMAVRLSASGYCS